MKAVERAVEKAILDEFREIESLGGVMAAVENRYQRSQIQNAAHRYEQQIYDGTRPIVGLTRYRDPERRTADDRARAHAAKEAGVAGQSAEAVQEKECGQGGEGAR